MDAVHNLTLFVHRYLLAAQPRVSKLGIDPDLCGFCATGAAILLKLLRAGGFHAELVFGRPLRWGMDPHHYWVVVYDPTWGAIHADPTHMQFSHEHPIWVSQSAPQPDRVEWEIVQKIDRRWSWTQHPRNHFEILGLGACEL